MNLTEQVDALNVLGDESRIRLCALLSGRELCVSALVRATGIAQSRVSPHLGRLREAGFVRDRRQGAQSFYGLPEAAVDELERDYSPGRTWHSLALGLAGLLRLGDVLDAGSGDGAAASTLAPHCRSLTCIDTNPQMIEPARGRLTRFRYARALVADLHQLPFDEASFDDVLMFHTLTYAAHPARAQAESPRLLRPPRQKEKQNQEP